ncbi:MAG: hypothetical protein ABR908_05055 [Terriglobales bacterium]|jgi:hypothetical protein
MEGRHYWIWLTVRLVFAVVIVGWSASYLFFPGGSGEKEFQKSLDAMKQVQTARIATVIDPTPTQHMEISWDLVCAQNAYRYRLHVVQPDQPNNAGQEQEEFHIGNLVYQRKLDDSWAARPTRTVTPNAVCQTLAQGTDSKLFPDLATMIQRGIIEKGDKKMVNDVRCREWKVTLKEPKGLEHLTVCLGLDDHLPYEMTMDWQHARATYYDYNATFQLDLPGAARPAGEISATN